MAADDTRELELDPKTRDALSKELFAHMERESPGAFHCFCGSDQDLVDAVQRYRAQAEREREVEP